ncbi:MAG: hypothetical protein E4H20_04975, partial [Spirochaetales bacterium]
MKLRTRVFAVSFLSSAALLGIAAVLAFSLRQGGDQRSVSESTEAIRELGERAAQGPLDPGTVFELIAPLKREAARRTILAEDRALGQVAAIALLLAAGTAAAFAVSMVAASLVTARWERVCSGLRELRSGARDIRFSTGTNDEFGMLESELDTMLDALSDRERVMAELKALQGWGEASAFLAHQAKTPLASLAISAHMLRESLASPNRLSIDQATEAAIRMEADSSRLRSLFDRVRSLSGFKELTPEIIDPEIPLREAAGSLALRFSGVTQDALAVIRSHPDEAHSFDRTYLREAFLNLLSNSAEACEQRGLPFSARLEIHAREDGYELTYSDSMTGLDPSVLGRIGTPRFTTKHDGAGLGVWLVGRI